MSGLSRRESGVQAFWHRQNTDAGRIHIARQMPKRGFPPDAEHRVGKT